MPPWPNTEYTVEQEENQWDKGMGPVLYAVSTQVVGWFHEIG